MPNISGPPNIIRLLFDLQNSDEARRQTIGGAPLPPTLALLRNWQTQRLICTYSDLLESKEYGPACEFFLSDIYAPRDFSQRDHDTERLHEILARFLPEQMLRLLADAIRVNRISNRLDNDLVKILFEVLGVTDTITPELYAKAYRICDNYADRKRQIDLLASTLGEAAEGARFPLVGVSLRVARGPAHAAGWQELYDFLERGYRAYKPMRNAKHFADTVCERELLILDRIFAEDPHPFAPWL